MSESWKLQAIAAECNFKVKFGTVSKPGYISSENLFKPSKRKDSYGKILADTCRAVGVEVKNTKLFSERVCNPCKIRNLGALYELVQNSIGGQAACKTPPKQNINVSKRLLETPPGSSPFRKTVRVNSPSPRLTESFSEVFTICNHS